MNRNSILLSLAVAVAMAGCSSYHAAYDEPNNSAYPNNPNTANTGISSNTESGAYRDSYQTAQNNTPSNLNTGNGYNNPSSSRYPPNVASNLNNDAGQNRSYSAYGPTSPAGSASGANAASASPSDNSVTPALSSSVKPGETNQMNNMATPAPAMNNTVSGTTNTASTPDMTKDTSSPTAAANGQNGDSAPAASPQLGGLNEKQTAAKNMTDADVKFIKDAHSGDEFEITAGQKALVKSQDPNIKKMAQKMVDDHTKADEQASAIANRNGDHDLGGLTADQLNQLAQLDKTNGADFDAEYLRQQKAAHEQTIAEFKKEAQSADNADLREWAAATLPVLQGHLDMINGQMNPAIGSER